MPRWPPIPLETFIALHVHRPWSVHSLSFTRIPRHICRRARAAGARPHISAAVIADHSHHVVHYSHSIAWMTNQCDKVSDIIMYLNFLTLVLLTSFLPSYKLLNRTLLTNTEDGLRNNFWNKLGNYCPLSGAAVQIHQYRKRDKRGSKIIARCALCRRVTPSGNRRPYLYLQRLWKIFLEACHFTEDIYDAINIFFTYNYGEGCFPQYLSIKWSRTLQILVRNKYVCQSILLNKCDNKWVYYSDIKTFTGCFILVFSW